MVFVVKYKIIRVLLFREDKCLNLLFKVNSFILFLFIVFVWIYILSIFMIVDVIKI